MKATGIVRRIDDLGRVVIPKEIRRTLRIREGDPLEIFVDREGEVILKKYSPIIELGEIAKDYAEALHKSLGTPVFISDRDVMIVVTGGLKKEFLGKHISSKVEDIMEKRSSFVVNNTENFALIEGHEEGYKSMIICPIIANGDPIGNVILFSTEQVLGELEVKSAETAASFLAKHMEQ